MQKMSHKCDVDLQVFHRVQEEVTNQPKQYHSPQPKMKERADAMMGALFGAAATDSVSVRMFEQVQSMPRNKS